VTRSRVYTLTGVAFVLYAFLNWAFADDKFKVTDGQFWLSHEIAASSLWTYVGFALILLAGYYLASTLPAEGVPAEVSTATAVGEIDDPTLWKKLMSSTYFSLLWLPMRFFVGLAWLSAGEHKIRDSKWMDTGESLQGYWTGATTIPEGAARSRSGYYDWYHDLLKYMLDNEWYTWFAKIIAVGEFLIGLGLVVGALVGIAAFFGTLLNFSFIMAGTSSSNPVLFGLGVFLVLGWKVAGYFGVDRYLLPMLGTPWKPGALIERNHYPTDRPGHAMQA